MICVLDFTLPDIAIVTSLRDGMNLVSYEFVACQDAKRGVLILSEVTMDTVNLVWNRVILFIVVIFGIIVICY